MSRKDRSQDVADRFGENMRRVRRREGLSQEQLAVRASLHRTEIGLLEKGRRVPRVDTLIQLAGAMAVPPCQLLDGIYWVPAPGSVGTFTLGAPLGARQRVGQRDQWAR